MREINRSVLIPKPREPYLAWVHSLDDEGKKFTLAQLRDDCVALLIPEVEGSDDIERFVEEHHEALFEYLLAAWMDDSDQWPECRDLETLLQWFDFEVSSLVFDVCDWALEHIGTED